ncbi:alpha/beta hydrolase [Kutzneria viridogrisea]|uniref:Lipase n=2 Tax=Kutzneria TaxID=43356 RepID=W5WQ13_9PSEU|nr:hypothetical protein [Kutzneria albida]AHI00265.1 hypothetical protein KALB_6906 [Kutzneria albida DSM 43870]MBA8925441.1 hypothetical protein [Kutzneria viridogrisea]
MRTATAVVAAVAAALVTAAPAAAAPVRPTLPAPTGHDRLGTVELHLVDPARTDPWTDSPAHRELMVSITYPARDTEQHPAAPWLPSGVAPAFVQLVSQSGIDLSAVPLPDSHAHTGAPAAGRHPVLLYSPGYGSVRELGTAQVEDLASRGYVVVTIDHTHEAPAVQFPGGRVEPGKQPTNPDIGKALDVRVADTRFVLDQLAVLARGGNPDAEHRALPPGLDRALDLSRTGMFGHSLGGNTAASVMAVDARVAVGANLDGAIHGPVADSGLDRPFLLVASQDHDRTTDPSWATFWSHLRGWHVNLKLTGSAHISYTDLQPVLGQLVAAGTVPADRAKPLIGTIDPDHSVAAQRAYLAAYFDLQLKHRDSGLLDGPSPCFPEVEFLR